MDYTAGPRQKTEDSKSTHMCKNTHIYMHSRDA